MRIYAVFSFCMILILLNATISLAEMQFAGIIKSVKGNAVILRHGQSHEAMNGMKIYMKDVIKTDKTCSIGLIFNDDTLVSMGHNSEIVIDEYYFMPLEGRLSSVLKIIHGTIAYLSGQISKLSPESVRLETPVATIGVRGTQILIKIEG